MMSSPRKRIKLTPKKQEDVSKRFTQESKVTSTPQRHNRNVASPNISRISSTTTNSSICTRLSDVFTEKENLTDSSSVESNVNLSTSRVSTPFSIVEFEIAVEDYDTYINEFRKTKFTGRVWKMYRPLHDLTLYAQILQDPRNVQELVTELLLMYTRRPERAVCILIKLCVDVCGFQHFEVADHYNFQENISKRIIEIMESSQVLDQQEVLINTGKYLFMESFSNLAKLLKASIYNFLQKLVICAHERGILYDDFFTRHFFMFVKYMSFSQISAIRHTGVIFGIKILTALVKIYSKITNAENSSTRESHNTQLQKQEINNYLEFFYLIFVKNCRLQENKLTLMRVECVYELSVWIKYFPKIFISQLQTISYLLKLIADPSKYVRLAALETCEIFVETPDILVILKQTSPDFVEHIGRRFYDVDIKVAIKAIDIYRKLLKHDFSLITTNRFKMLMNLVVDKYFPIGEAASRFLISYLEKIDGNGEILLLQLAKFSMKPGNYTKQLVVEGCLNHCSEIQNWKLYINIFVHSNVELDIKECLAELFAEAVHQVLVGTSTILREKSRKVTSIDIVEHKKVATYFPIFATLLEKYSDQSKILTEFLKIFVNIEGTIINKVSNDTVKKLCYTMQHLFHYHDDEKLLKILSETIHHFSNTEVHANQVQAIIKNISSKYANDLIANLTNQKEEAPNTVIKVSILFTNFNLTKILKWETLFDNWSEVDEKTTASLLSCCKWYLLWSLRNLNTESDTTQFDTLKQACNEYISTCFNMLQNLKGQPLHFKTYDCLCDIYIIFTQELAELMKSFKQMEQLKLVVNEKQLQNILILFLEKYVISNTTMPLIERRSYVRKFINMAHLNVLSIKCLGHVYKYYNVYNKEYGPLIDSSLATISQIDENTFLMMILYTCTLCYEHILSKYNAVDMTTQEVKSIKLLIKQFMIFKEFKHPQKKFVKLIYFAINYSFKEASNYTFLYFAKYFADLIVLDDDRKEALKFLKEKVPKEAEKNDAVLFLSNYLKHLKPGAISEKTVTKQKRTNISKKNKENARPKKKAEVQRRKGHPKSLGKKTNKIKTNKTVEKAKKMKNIDTETDVSDNLTIHDSESDDIDESFTALKM